MTQRRSMTPEDVYRLQTPSDAQISPDGSRVAYTVTRADAEKDELRSAIWVVAVTGGEPRPFTNGPKRDTQPRWSPDGTRLAFVSDRGEGGQIYVMPADGGEARKLTSLEEGAANPVWSPDGTRLAFTAHIGAEREPKDEDAKKRLRNRPVEINELKYKFDAIGHYRGRHTQVLTVSAEGGEATALTSGPFENTSPSWSPDGATIAFVSARHDERDFNQVSDVFLVAASGGEPRRLTPGRGPSMAPSWSPDGRQIAYAGNQNPEGQFGARNLSLWVIDAAGGEPREVTRDFDRSVMAALPPMGGVAPIWSDAGRSLVFVASDAGNAHLFRVAARGGRPEKILGGVELTLATASASRDGARLAVDISRIDLPGAILTLNADGSGERQLTHHNQDLLDELSLFMPERLSFRGTDGGEFEGWLIRPAGAAAGGPVPLLLDVHGGPHGAWGPGFTPTAHTWQVLAGRGWAILYINPRGSGGYGEGFATYIRNGWGERDFPDFMTAVDQMVERGIADPERLAVTGYSYGGYMTNWIVGHTERFKAAVAGGCVSNLASMWGTSDVGVPFEDWEFGGPWWEQRERYARLSPISSVDRVTTPLLLMHAEGDLRCPIGQSEEMFAALRRQRKPVQFVRFPGGSHGFRQLGTPSHRVEYARRLIDWIERFTAVGQRPVRELAGAPAGD